jgi:hypothetical protein
MATVERDDGEHYLPRPIILVEALTFAIIIFNEYLRCSWSMHYLFDPDRERED